MVIADLSFFRTTIKKDTEAGRNRWRVVSKWYVLFSIMCLGPLGRFWHAFTLSGVSETRLGYVSAPQTHLAHALTPSGASEAHCACFMPSQIPLGHVYAVSRAWDAFWTFDTISRVWDAFWRPFHRLESLRCAMDSFTLSRGFTPSREFQTCFGLLYAVLRVSDAFWMVTYRLAGSRGVRTLSHFLKSFSHIWDAFTPSQAILPCLERLHVVSSILAAFGTPSLHFEHSKRIWYTLQQSKQLVLPYYSPSTSYNDM
jgi:hypothetical protein